MFNHIMVGIDGHDGGRDALALASNLRSPDGELTLAHVFTGDPHIYRSASDSYDAAAREHSLELLSAARGEAEIDAELRCHEAGSVGRGLHELVERASSELLVIGSCGRGLLGRVLVGDDTRAALNGAPCAVAVAPAGYSRAPAQIRRIGVGFDGSSDSVAALELGRELARVFDAQLSALEVVPSMTRFGPGPLPLSDVIDPLVARAQDRVAALGGVEPHACYGDPADELSLYSASLDLLITGSRGYGPIGRLVHGSTSQQLLQGARCPILVLPRGVSTPARSPVAAATQGRV